MKYHAVIESLFIFISTTAVGYIMQSVVAAIALPIEEKYKKNIKLRAILTFVDLSSV